MVATTNLPGSSHFRYFVGTKTECEAWLEKREEECKRLHQGAWFSVYDPGQIITNKEARRWRYRDGTRVFNFMS